MDEEQYSETWVNSQGSTNANSPDGSSGNAAENNQYYNGIGSGLGPESNIPNLNAFFNDIKSVSQGECQDDSVPYQQTLLDVIDNSSASTAFHSQCLPYITISEASQSSYPGCFSDTSFPPLPQSRGTRSSTGSIPASFYGATHHLPPEYPYPLIPIGSGKPSMAMPYSDSSSLPMREPCVLESPSVQNQDDEVSRFPLLFNSYLEDALEISPLPQLDSSSYIMNSSWMLPIQGSSNFTSPSSMLPSALVGATTAIDMAPDLRTHGPQRLKVPETRGRRRSEPLPLPGITRTRMERTGSTGSDRSQALSVSSQSSGGRGRRKGPMSEENKHTTYMTRMDRTVCIRCSNMKIKCVKSNPDLEKCIPCSKAAERSPERDISCVKLHFMNMVPKTPIEDYVPGYIDHICPDQIRRQIQIPRNINFPELIDRLHNIGPKWDIRVFDKRRWQCHINVGVSVTYLRALTSSLKSVCPLRTFLGLPLQKNDPWQKCVEGSDWGLSDLLEVLAKWGATPNMLSYDLVSRDTGVVRPLNPCQQWDHEMIRIAAQLSFVILRRIELEAYTQLQKYFKEHNTFYNELRNSLGQLLFSLRWRISLRGLDGKKLQNDHAAKEEYDAYTKGLRGLLRSLYSQYCTKSSYFRGRIDGTHRNGQINRYAGCDKAIDEILPHEDTDEGFERWMKQGEDIAREA